MVVLIAAAVIAAAVLPTTDERRIWGVGANVLALVWLSFEAYGYFEQRPGDQRQALQFTLSAIWGLYATTALVAGVMARRRTARLFAIGLFGVVIVKMGLSDLWTLPTGYRFIGFIGLGTILLACSLMYNRFREMILGE